MILSLFVTLLVLCVVFSLAYWIVGLLPIPAPMAPVRNVFYILLGLAAICCLLDMVGIMGTRHVLIPLR